MDVISNYEVIYNEDKIIITQNETLKHESLNGLTFKYNINESILEITNKSEVILKYNDFPLLNNHNKITILELDDYG